MVIVNCGIHGNKCTKVAPHATLAKIAGKIVPPRQPRVNPKLAIAALAMAIKIRESGANNSE